MLKFRSLSALLCFTIVASASFAQKPCDQAEYRQFDFWVGEWEVTKPDGSPAGTNSITLGEDNCVVVEHWTSAKPPYTGTSYSFYNPQTGHWHQTWVDNQGGSLLLEGERKGNQMILFTEEVTDQQGKKVNRVTWTDNGDGTVRQHWEVTRDGGTTWTTAFDGLYKPRK